MRILVLNGPNLNLLGARDQNHYGKLTLNEIEERLKSEYPSDSFSFFQSNIEGELVDKIQSAQEGFDGLIINPGGYSHTSVAIRDALEMCNIPKIEVHLSNLAQREDFRSKTITAQSTTGYISGFKEFGYSAAVFLMKKLIRD